MGRISFDKAFYKRFFMVSIPIAAQQLLKALMYFIDNIMIGSLGEDAIVGVGNANQIAFFIMVFMFGIGSAGWVFAARFNGEGDKKGITKTLGVCLAGTLIVGALFFVLSQTVPGGLISIFNPHPGVVKQGGDYIQIVGISYVFIAISLSYSNVLKGCEKTRLPMIASGIAIAVNAFLNYVLIFGKFGFPELGVKGAAIGTAVGAFLDAALLIVISNIKRNEVAGGLRKMFPRRSHMRPFIKQFAKIGSPMIINEFLWSVSIMLMVIIYNRMGLEVAAAMAVYTALERMAYVVYAGIAHASGVMVGNQIGAGNKDKAYEYGKRFLKITPLSTIVVGGLVILVLPVFLRQYDISPATLEITRNVVYSFTAIAWMMTINFTNMVGVLRGGGDTRYSMIIDLIGSWVFTLTTAFVTGIVLRWPAHWVYVCAIVTGDIFKMLMGLRRFKSKKWMHDITSGIGTVSTLEH